MKILLMGNPNVGKSVVFNRLSGANAIESNYPGTTVDYEKGYVSLNNTEYEFIDAPGTFSLEPKDKAEEVAVKLLEKYKDAVIICVIDASKIERGLYLALELIERGYKLIIALNMWDVAEDNNIKINVERLNEILQVPVIPTIAISGEGVKTLSEQILSVKPTTIQYIINHTKGGSS